MDNPINHNKIKKQKWKHGFKKGKKQGIKEENKRIVDLLQFDENTIHALWEYWEYRGDEQHPFPEKILKANNG